MTSQKRNKNQQGSKTSQQTNGASFFRQVSQLRGVIFIFLYILSCFGLSLANTDKFIQFANFGLGFFSILIGGFQLQDWYWFAGKGDPSTGKKMKSQSVGGLYLTVRGVIWLAAILLPPLVLVKIFNIN